MSGLMTFFITMAAVSLVLIVVESAVYLAKAGWYYRMGPALHVERWQTAVPVDEARDAVIESLAAVKWSHRVGAHGVSFRRHWAAMSAWPRVYLRIEPGAAGAVLSYEVRPFITLAMFGLLTIGLIFTGLATMLVVVQTVVIAVIYAAFWPWELRHFGRLRPLRDALRPIGVRICNTCGYDLFTHDVSRPCPECGTMVEDQHPPLAESPSSSVSSPPSAD